MPAKAAADQRPPHKPSGQRKTEVPGGTRVGRAVERARHGNPPQRRARVQLRRPVAAEVLLPLMEFQARRPMRKQLRNLLEVVKARAEAAGTSSGRDEPKFGGEAPA